MSKYLKCVHKSADILECPICQSNKSKCWYEFSLHNYIFIYKNEESKSYLLVKSLKVDKVFWSKAYRFYRSNAIILSFNHKSNGRKMQAKNDSFTLFLWYRKFL